MKLEMMDQERHQENREMKGMVRSLATGGAAVGAGSGAELPQCPLQTLEELTKLCSDLQRMPASKKQMVGTCSPCIYRDFQCHFSQ